MAAPWFVGGGAVHDAITARLLANAATGDSQGVVASGHYQVLPLSVPGPQIRILPGAGVLRAAPYTGGSFQSYMTRRAVETVLGITATGSAAGRSDLVIQRIDDPQFGGTLSPTSPTAIFDPFVIIPGVPAGTTQASELGLPYPAIALARIDLPASTGTVLASHIRDLRRLAHPVVPAWEMTGSADQLVASGPATGVKVATLKEATGLTNTGLTGAGAADGAFVTIATGGIYNVSMATRVAAGGAAGERACFITVNSGAQGTEIRIPGTSFDGNRSVALSATGNLRLFAGDIIRPFMYQTSGISLALNDLAGTIETRFSGVFLAR